MSDMLNVKRALFQVMVAKYFSSCIPVIGETEEGEGRVLRGFGLHGFKHAGRVREVSERRRG